MFYALCAVWGIGNGVAMANLLAVIYEFCEVRLLTLLLGLSLFAQGIGGSTGNYSCSKYSTVSAITAKISCLAKVCKT